jgi:hypothetical protein
MTIRHPKTLGAGIVLLVLAFLAVPFVSPTRTISSTQEHADDGTLGIRFGTEVEEQAVDLRVPGLLGISGVGLMALAILRRP